MRNVCAIARRELLSFFVSPIAYFVISGFILLAAYFYLNMLAVYNFAMERYSMMPYSGMMAMPNLNVWVVQGFYNTLLVILVFLIPLLTMRLFADERRFGTFELLMTSPISMTEVVCGKYLGLVVVISLMCLAVGIFPLLLVFFGTPGPELLPVFSGLLAVWLCGIAFGSIGMACSSMTENQIVAGVSTMVILLILFVIYSPTHAAGGFWAEVLKSLSPTVNAEDLVKGVIGVRSLVYFLSIIALGTFVSKWALQSYRWR